MFECVEDAVQVCRATVVEHHRATERGDLPVMDAAALKIRSVMVYLRKRERTELIHPLTMEWVNERRDPAEHERFRAVVDLLLHAFPDRPSAQQQPADAGRTPARPGPATTR